MNTQEDLDAVRATVRAQISRAAEVQRRLGLIDAAPATDRWPGLVLRCEKPHTGGKKPKVAEVHSTPHGIFYVARLPWTRSDAGKLLPWHEESHLARTFGGDPSYLDDDALLRQALKQMAWWRQRGQGDVSWIAERQSRAHQLTEILNLPSTEGMLTLWARCPTHLNEYESVDPTRLLSALR